MRMQLMASARHARVSTFYGHAACVQSHELEEIASLLSMVPRRVAVLLVLLWSFLRLGRTHRALRVSSSYIDGAVPQHSIELALDISLAHTRLQGPLSPRSSS